MAKGQAQRRRAKNFLEAKDTKSGRLSRLPPPPEGPSKKGKRNSDVSRSLQRMLDLKALAQSPKHSKKGPVVQQHPTVPAAKLNATMSAGNTAGAGAAATAAALPQSRAPLPDEQDVAAPPSQEARNPEPHPSAAPHNSQGMAAGGPEASKSAETSAAPVTERRLKQQKNGQQPQHAAPALSAGVKTLKPRKKDFLKRRKLKKKGLLHLLDEEPEEDLEAELMQDRHKPKFGEQAMAPLKIHLKRKHWDSTAEQGRSSKRCTDIYERQMSDANGNRAQASSSVRQPAHQQGGSSKGGAGKRGSEAVQRLKAQQATQAQKLAQGRAQLQAIEAYRSSKRPNTSGKASFKTLKQLVKKGEAATPMEG